MTGKPLRVASVHRTLRNRARRGLVAYALVFGLPILAGAVALNLVMARNEPQWVAAVTTCASFAPIVPVVLLGFRMVTEVTERAALTNRVLLMRFRHHLAAGDPAPDAAAYADLEAFLAGTLPVQVSAQWTRECVQRLGSVPPVR